MSFDYTGSFSGSFTGEIVAVNGVLSSSAQVAANLPAGVVSSSTQVSYGGTGLISSSRQIEYSQVKNKPVTITSFQKNAKRVVCIIFIEINRIRNGGRCNGVGFTNVIIQ